MIAKRLGILLFFLLIHISCGPNIQFYGCIEGDCQDGIGTWLNGSGSTFTGQFRNGKRQGSGTLVYPSGEKWEGQWKDDKKWNGNGTIMSVWYKYVGQYKMGKRNGNGEFTFFDWPYDAN